MLRAGAFYAASAWLLVQVATQVLPFFDLPNWLVRWVIVAALVGFPFWMAFAWFHEITPTGFARDVGGTSNESERRATGRKLDLWIIGILACAVILLLTDRFVTRPHPAPDAQAAAMSDAAIPAKSVAVLPFNNVEGDRDQQFFSDGLSEDLITALSQFDGLKVISRESSFQFRNRTEDADTVGHKLGVAHLLEGSVRRRDDQVRINARLVATADGHVVWSQRYDRPYADLFALQDAITRAVAEALKVKLLAQPGAVPQTDRPPSGNLDAYAAYLRGVSSNGKGTEEGTRAAIAAFEEALRIEPAYAAAQASLSIAWLDIALVYNSGSETETAFANARAAARTALALAPDLAVVHSAQAYQLLVGEMDWKGAEAEARHALDLAPNDAFAKYLLGNMLATLGDLDSAIALTRQAIESNPRAANLYLWLAQYLMGKGQLDEAVQSLNAGASLRPDALGQDSSFVIIEILRGNADKALALARERSGDDASSTYDIALALQAGTDRQAADAALEAQQAGESAEDFYAQARLHAVRGDAAAMFHALDRAWEARDPNISTLMYDPLLLHYRNDPRFAAYCVKVGLPAPMPAEDTRT